MSTAKVERPKPPASPDLSTAESAAYLGVPEGTLRAWRHQGRAGNHPAPPSYRMGRHVKYPLDQLERWRLQVMESQQREGGAAG